MADYPFRINITTGDDTEIGFYTASFATSAENFVSSSVIVERINNLFRADFKRAATGSHADFNPANDANYYNGDKPGTTQIGSNTYLSASTETIITGSITFTDTETSTNGGLKFYEFFGSKVCQVLGLPEGVPIYTENFKLSDDVNDKTNYLSGQVIADAVTVKESISFAPQSRMKSNIQWDEENGEGLLQWTSGSTATLRVGYNPDGERYTIAGPIDAGNRPLKPFTIAGFSHVEGAHMSTGSFGRLDVGIGQSKSPQEYWMPFCLTSAYDDGGAAQRLVPLVGQTDAASLDRQHIFISPFDMKWVDVMIRSESTPGVSYANMFVLADGDSSVSLGGGSTSEGEAFSIISPLSVDDTVNIGSAPAESTSGGTLEITRGQAIVFTIDPTNATGHTTVTFGFRVRSSTTGV